MTAVADTSPDAPTNRGGAPTPTNGVGGPTADAAPRSAGPGSAPAAATQRTPDQLRGSRTAWQIWSLGVAVYFVAVFHRSSLGVAGVLAAQRFGVGSTALAAFPMVQLLVYAGMQIPVGVLVDRFGPRRLLVTGLVVMAAGQGMFAVVHGLGPALLARALLGCGDAMTFVSVLRLVAAWFPPRRNALVVQLTALVGQTGSIVSTFPLSAALHGLGWTPTFLGAAIASVLLSGVAVRGLADSPAGYLQRRQSRDGHPKQGRAEGDQRRSGMDVPLRVTLREAARTPWTRAGFFVHFTTQFPSTVFGMLWGYPFLVQGEGLSPAQGSLLLSELVVAAMVYGQVFGVMVARRPEWRLKLAVIVVLATALAFAAVLLWPGRAPLPVLVAFVAVVASGGPASMIGFDLARTGNPIARLGTATGMVNVGGFTASVVTLLVIGLVLDHLSPGGPESYTLGAFRWAFLSVFVLQALGLTVLVRIWRRLPRARPLAWRGRWVRWIEARDVAESTAGGAAPLR
ncbi:MAG: MFS transporter [Actinomycetales bacterium]